MKTQLFQPGSDTPAIPAPSNSLSTETFTGAYFDWRLPGRNMVIIQERAAVAPIPELTVFYNFSLTDFGINNAFS
jgi:hypothetical protein